MRECACHAGKPSALADPELVVEPVDLAVTRTNFAGSQRVNRLGGALLKRAIVERSHVRRHEIFARHDKSSAAAQFKRRRVAVQLEIEHAHANQGTYSSQREAPLPSHTYLRSYDKLPGNMAVKTEKELSESLRACWLKAVSAIELRNFGYAISLLQEILKQEPEFLTGRQLLRRSEVTKTKSAKKSFFNISSAPIGVMKAQREIKKDPKRAVEMLEEVLEAEPYNRQANLLLKEAALAAGWSEIAVFALQTLLEENSRDVKVLNELGRLYHELGDHEKEVEIYNQLTAINPLDAQALRLGKDASARASVKM